MYLSWDGEKLYKFLPFSVEGSVVLKDTPPCMQDVYVRHVGKSIYVAYMTAQSSFPEIGVPGEVACSVFCIHN